jgi:hypothetical protein
MIRDTAGTDASNPFDVEVVKTNIHAVLFPKYNGQYKIVVVPNITHIGYGRGVGYTIEQEVFTDEIHAISATQIRKEMGI